MDLHASIRHVSYNSNRLVSQSHVSVSSSSSFFVYVYSLPPPPPPSGLPQSKSCPPARYSKWLSLSLSLFVCLIGCASLMQSARKSQVISDKVSRLIARVSSQLAACKNCNNKSRDCAARVNHFSLASNSNESPEESEPATTIRMPIAARSASIQSSQLN